jgi:hypothetical protein
LFFTFFKGLLGPKVSEETTALYFRLGISGYIQQHFSSNVNTTDFKGNDRFIDGDGDGNDAIDIGSYEYDPNF